MNTPPSVRDLALRMGASEHLLGKRVSFTQEGRLRSDAHGKWTEFRARQESAIRQCALAWHARAGPLLAVRVADVLNADGGSLSATLFGIVPVTAASGPQVTRGEIMRYLAELAWCPDAIMHNASIGWTLEAPDRLVASARLGDVEGRVTLQLDAQGRIASISAPDRPRSVGRDFIDTPWWGRFDDFHDIEGRQIPQIGEVGWIIEGESVAVWQGRLTGWTLQDRT